MTKRRRASTPFQRDWWYHARRADAAPAPRWQTLLVWLVVLLFTVPLLIAIADYLF